MKKIFKFICGVLLMGSLMSFSSCSSKKVTWAGCRSSSYGIKPFPSVEEWCGYVNKVKSNYPGSQGALIWIVGKVNEGAWTCNLNFPVGETPENVFDNTDDVNEKYLREFDDKNYAVWLQVEPGNADLNELATIVLNRYKRHKCVKGFGVDVEWFKPANTNGYGRKFTDEMAEELDATVKAVNKNYTLFVKHWDYDWLPPTYRSDMIFVNDSQEFESMDHFKEEFTDWAEHFQENPVIFQIGYRADKHLWGKLNNPVKDLGNFLVEDLYPYQQHGIIWVDFTLRDVLENK